MRFRKPICVAGLSSALLAGCVDEKHAAVEDAYRRGEITSAQYRQHTREENEKLIAKQEAWRVRSQEDPVGEKKPIFTPPPEEPTP